jgi:hypothetical protein
MGNGKAISVHALGRVCESSVSFRDAYEYHCGLDIRSARYEFRMLVRLLCASCDAL